MLVDLEHKLRSLVLPERSAQLAMNVSAPIRFTIYSQRIGTITQTGKIYGPQPKHVIAMPCLLTSKDDGSTGNDGSLRHDGHEYHPRYLVTGGVGVTWRRRGG